MAMFSLTTATRVFVAPGATDMRKGFDGLFGLATSPVALDPLAAYSNEYFTPLTR
jgi:transposase